MDHSKSRAPTNCNHGACWCSVEDTELETGGPCIPLSVRCLSPDPLKFIISDAEKGVYDVVGCATPCETLPPLKEAPAGQRPFRSPDSPDWLPQEELTESEVKQLKDADRMILSARLGEIRALAGLWIENPGHSQPNFARVQAAVNVHRLWKCSIPHRAESMPEGPEVFGPQLQDRAQQRDLNEAAIGDMRNAKKSALMVPQSIQAGSAVRELLMEANSLPRFRNKSPNY